MSGLMRRLQLPILLMAVALAALAVTVACGDDDDDDSGSTETTVAVTLADYDITIDRGTAASGSVRFETTNDGAVPHELVIIKTDLGVDELPVSEARVPEDAVDLIGEIEEFDAGTSMNASFDLGPGKYVLICNIPGHYDLGMRVAFVVE
jgi:uncharacterized cupredoxin-like copper-binding protein